MDKKWKLYDYSAERVEIEALAAELGESKIMGRLLWHRHIRIKEEALAFLQPETRQEFHDPFLLRDMDKAVRRLQKAIADEESIVVYGDYDVDGITATTLLTKNLRALGAKKVDFYIPDRQSEGYGLNAEALTKLAEEYSLLVSVDCGIASVEDVAAIKDKLDVIITDHHLPGEELPPAVAVVNPHREDCPYPCKYLAGVGVSFKLCQGLWQKLRGVHYTGDMDIVALGTIADIVPLLGENRKIAKMGLKIMPDTTNPGLAALIDVACLRGKNIGSGQVGFLLAPRLNAAGRIGDANQGVKLLLTEDKGEALEIATALNEENLHRQEIERDIVAMAEEKMAALNTNDAHSIVVDGEDWHPGVIGIVASRLVDKYYRPSVVITREGENGKGSCRSIKGFNIYEALDACKEYLTGFGGHSQAAGLNLKTENIPAFREALEKYAASHLTAEDFTPTIDIEFPLQPQELTLEIAEEITRLEPYGMGNPKPLFAASAVLGVNARAIGRDEQHLAYDLPGGEVPVSAILWNQASYAGVVTAEPMDIVYVPKVNEWQGTLSIECFLEELTPTKENRVFPQREILKHIYIFLRELQEKRGHINGDKCTLTVKFSRRHPISLYTMECALQIFTELNLLGRDEENRYILLPPQHKMNLMDSPLFRRHQEKF
ncbi:MAG: single-stranded-DNA-specific exonuclease RecJ [Selenomonadaceae bacterium]|nr:single-stranded-DNA-specific exonuclease RecJ [Selenomonadaceae bacterium]